MNNMMVETVRTIDPKKQGGQRAYIGLGFNGIYGQEEHRFGIEIIIPVQQRLNGPQLERDLSFSLGYQKAFN